MKVMQGMLLCTMSCSFHMEKLDGIKVYMFQEIPGGSLSYNTQHTVFILNMMSSQPSYKAAGSFKLTWWICSPVLIRIVFTSFICSNLNCKSQFSME